ncbi:MAG TPA: replication-relaxation family protein [Lacipirellulaceae bacterium]|nr:replication-relaxation family protein [Lacipirellulaceae bacterium]
MILQARDVALLRELLESRVLSLEQIRRLFFAGKDEMAKKRVQRLKAAALLVERPRRVGEASLLQLSWSGFVALRDRGEADDHHFEHSPKSFARRMRVSPLTLAHELAVAHVRTAFTLALRGHERYSLERFDVVPRRFEFTVLHDGDDVFAHDFFLEVDRGTETLARVVGKCVHYREYYRSGGYAKHCGGNENEAKAYPFRVLVVCGSSQRRDNLLVSLRAVNPPIVSMVLIATREIGAGDLLFGSWINGSGAQDSALS